MQTTKDKWEIILMPVSGINVRKKKVLYHQMKEHSLLCAHKGLGIMG